MQLNPRQFGDFERDGYLLLPWRFSVAEVTTLRVKTDRLSFGQQRQRGGPRYMAAHFE